MHQSSLEKMTSFVNQYLRENTDEVRTIIDFGSQDINGSYRSLFSEKEWNYIGIDIEEGENVDLIIKDQHKWTEIIDSSIDVVISGQALEHTKYFWLIFQEIYRVLKPGGHCCIIVPSSGPEHRHPIDCWRFFPDGMKALCDYSGLRHLETRTDKDQGKYNDGSDLWCDTILIGIK
ncbi:MAG: class I SAM-dependent methyltransferase [Opitutae bacterium]|jgi:SAM-dependent methyltransferase|nr:class I SAM-dependent methyltransferase [Opitutae bacterium]